MVKDALTFLRMLPRRTSLNASASRRAALSNGTGRSHTSSIRPVPLAGIRMIAAAVFALASLAPAIPAEASAFVVNTADNTWDGHCDAHCSLWDAQQAAFMHPGPDRITFAIPGDGPHVIMLATPEGRTFPPIRVGGDGTEFDATTQPDWPVYLHGLGLAGWGMWLDADDCAVRGLGFLGFNEAGILVSGNRNFLDRVVAGDVLERRLMPAPLGNAVGIELQGEDNAIRGAYVGNNTIGILLSGPGQTVQDSQIGFRFGTAARRGNEKGLLAYALADGNTIERNSVVGNTEVGIELLSSGNVLTANWIGWDNSRGVAVGNGVGIQLGVTGGNRVGGIDANQGNIIVDNGIGVEVFSPSNQLINNRIGVDFAGTAIPNETGVALYYGSDGTLLGAGWSGAGNVIAHNSGDGILIRDSLLSQVEGNTIYSNNGDGVRVEPFETSPPAAGLQATIQRNSIYDNGGLGIRIPDPSANGNVEPPVLRRVSAGTVRGRACPDCRVEVFLAAPDPSGDGEGKTYLSEATAGSDGSFRAEVTGLHACDMLTATSTDERGNTSAFSHNLQAGVCARLSAFVAMGWIILAAGGGSALGVILRRRPLTLRVLPWALIGGLLGVGFGVLMLRLPFVQIDWGQPEGQRAPAPAGGNQPAPVTITITPTITLTPVTPGPGPEAMARQDANCRQGPSTQFNVASHLTQGQVVPITGRLAQGGWWQVQPPDLQIPCWIAENLVEAYGDLTAVQLVVSPPTPTPTPTEEPPSPPQGCWCWTQQQQCVYMPQCPAQCTPCP